MKPDFVTAEGLLDILTEEKLAIAALVDSNQPSLDLLSNLDKLDGDVPVYVVMVSTVDDAKLLQVIKLPQLRLFKSGSEIRSHVGSPALDVLKKFVSELRDHG